MLQFIREKAQGWIAWVIIGLLSITFALWGIQNYSSSGDHRDVLATVDSVAITRHAVDNKYQRMQEAFEVKFGLGALNEKVQASMQEEALQQLITAEVLAQANKQDGFHLSPQLLGQAVISIPPFLQDGKFSNERYEQVLAHIGFTKEGFLAELEQSILNSQIKFGIQQSGFVLSNEVADAFRLLNEERDIAYLIIPRSPIVISEQALQHYYQTHPDAFKRPEKVSIEYIRLSADQFKEKIAITDAEMKEFYTNNNDLYRGKNFFDVKEAVKNNLMQQKLQQLYAQATEDLAELSYTNPNALNILAQTYTLPIQSTELFTREGGGQGTLTADPKIISAAFSDDVLLHRNNSAPIPIDQTTIIVLRIKHYEPASMRPFAEVRETIQQLLATELASIQAKELSQHLANDLQNAKLSAADIAARYQKQWNKKEHINRHTSEVPAQILKNAFEASAPRDGHPSFVGLPLDQNNFALIAVNAVYPGKSTASLQESEKMHQKLEHDYTEAEYEFYVKSKIAKAKIVMNKSQQK